VPNIGRHFLLSLKRRRKKCLQDYKGQDRFSMNNTLSCK
jgi:hypothetical protein